jgi:hypothetical protein
MASRDYNSTLSPTRPGGFMLIEAALTTVIIGVAVVALLAVIGSATATNGNNRELTRGVFLAQEIREMLAPLPACQDGGRFGPEPGEALASFNDLDDFNGQTFTPPINAQRQALPADEWAGWTQSVAVANIDPNYLAGHQTIQGGSTDMIRVTVEVRKDGRLVYRLSWLAAAAIEE